MADEEEEDYFSPPLSPLPQETPDEASNDAQIVSDLKQYLRHVQQLPERLVSNRYVEDQLRKDIEEFKTEYGISENTPTAYNLLREIERTVDFKLGEKQSAKKRKIDDSQTKPRTLSIFEKLRNNTKSILNIRSQSNVLINGITKSGKSTFISRLFSPEFWSFTDMITNVYLFSKIDVQEAWANLQRNCDSLGIKLHVYRTIDTLPDLQKSIPKLSVLIVDDFMVDAIKDKKLMNLLTDLFNVTTHHNDIISIFTLHNLFADGFRTMRLNSDYIFLFSNPVDVNSVKVFFRQLENEQKAQLLFIAYRRAISESQPFGIQIMKNLEHKFFFGFSNLIMFVTDDELKDIESKFKLVNDGKSV